MPISTTDPTEQLAPGRMILTTTRNLFPGVVTFVVSCDHGCRMGVQDRAFDRRGMYRHLVARHRAEIGCGCSG